MGLVKRELKSRQRHLEKTAVVKAEAYIVSIGRKTTVYRLEAVQIAFFFGNTYHEVHSNAFPYFADLSVSSSLYHLYFPLLGGC